VSAPGDRRDEELQRVGALCAEGFDELVVFELDEDRGRPRGETALLLAAGAAQAAGGRVPPVRLAARDALCAARERCRPGDTLVYACATELKDLRDAFGEDMLIAEERWAPALRLAWSAAAMGDPGRRQEQA
jgi:cyanophycin synthetase